MSLMSIRYGKCQQNHGTVNVRGTFLTIKHFLKSAEISQEELGAELPNLAVVVTGSECGKFSR